MNDKDKKRFAELIYGLSEENGGTVTKNGIVLKFEALKKYTIEQISAAAGWLVKNRETTFPPVPRVTEFEAAIKKISGELDASPKAEVEADKVFKKLREWGREAQPLFYDDITKYLMTHRWTFPQLDQMSIKDPGLVWFRKEFISAYQDMVEHKAAAGGNLLPNYPGDGDAISAKRLNLLTKTKRIEGDNR